MTKKQEAKPTELDAQFAAALKLMFEEKIKFNKVLGLQITSIKSGNATGRIDMKPELAGHLTQYRLHGGVVSAVLDSLGGLALMAEVGARHMGESVAQRVQRCHRVGTIDLRVDYLRQAISEHFELRSEVVRMGSRVGTVRMECLSASGVLIAVGSGAYIVS